MHLGVKDIDEVPEAPKGWVVALPARRCDKVVCRRRVKRSGGPNREHLAERDQ